MPQLALETFITQYFWLLVIFFSFYFISVTSVIPRISTLMKSREKISASTTTEESRSEGSADFEGTFQVVRESAYGLKESTNWKNYLGKWLSQEKGRTKKRSTKTAAKSTKAEKSKKAATKKK